MGDPKEFENITGEHLIIVDIVYSIGVIGKFQVLKNSYRCVNLVTKFELRRSAFISAVLMIMLLIIAGGIWFTASQYGILKEGELMYKMVVTVQLILITLSFMFSMVFFGCIAEHEGREPGVITLALSYIPPVLYMVAIKMFSRLIYFFAVVSVFVVLYFLYSE